jgi:hypothetical protein
MRGASRSKQSLRPDQRVLQEHRTIPDQLIQQRPRRPGLWLLRSILSNYR